MISATCRAIDAIATAASIDRQVAEIMAEWDHLFFRLWTAEMRAECARLVGVDHDAGHQLASDALEALTSMAAESDIELFSDTFAGLESTHSAAG